MLTRSEIEDIVAAAFKKALAEKKPASGVTRITASGDENVLAKAAGGLDVAVADFRARVLAHVKEDLGIPQPMDMTTERPVALKRASQEAETRLRSDAASRRRPRTPGTPASWKSRPTSAPRPLGSRRSRPSPDGL